MLLQHPFLNILLTLDYNTLECSQYLKAPSQKKTLLTFRLHEVCFWAAM